MGGDLIIRWKRTFQSALKDFLRRVTKPLEEGP